jgi:membrane fusion protein (multidrug efflux system)
MSHRLSVAALCTILVMLVACDEKPPAARQQAGPPPAVFVTPVARQAVNAGVDFIGRVEALEKVEVRARVTGFLREVTFVEGQIVKAGDMIYEIEREPFAAQVALAQAQLERAEADAKNASLQVQRGRELVRSSTIAQSTQDQRVADADSATANVSARRAELTSAKIQLDYTRILAPIEGRIGRSAVTPGNVVGPNTGVLTTIVRQSPMRVIFPVSQRAILEWRRGTPDQSFDAIQARIRLADGRLYDQTGKLNFIDVKTDRATDSVQVQAIFDNPKAILSDGQFVSVLVEAKQAEQTLVMPQSAVQVDQTGPYVLVVGADNKVSVKRVKLGRGESGLVAVQEGLAEGEKVITEGAQRARPGATVAPRPAEAMPGATAGGGKKG